VIRRDRPVYIHSHPHSSVSISQRSVPPPPVSPVPATCVCLGLHALRRSLATLMRPQEAQILLLIQRGDETRGTREYVPGFAPPPRAGPPRGVD
jgi:hypothetical protein